MLTINTIATTHTGNIRQNNEDNFYINGTTLAPHTASTTTPIDSSTSGLFAVYDGMGGEAFGEIAASIAANTLGIHQSQILDLQHPFADAIENYTTDANTAICNKMSETKGKRIGTTFALLAIKNNTAHIANIGDSRVYLFRNNQLTQLSKDHTQVSQMVAMGILSTKQAKVHPARNRLTQHLGIFPDEMIIEPFIAEPIAVTEGDKFLLCSDGLTDMVCDEDIERILQEDIEPTLTVQNLITKALENGGRDNVTIIVAAISKQKSLLSKIKSLAGGMHHEQI